MVVSIEHMGRACAVVVACLGLAACGGGGSSPASATPDGGVSSTSTPDGGATSTPDGGTSASPDGGTASAPDGGTSASPDGGTSVAPDGGTGTVATTPPMTKDGWTFYDTGQGLSAAVTDVSADEGGNVYVAGGDALYAKKRTDASFLRLDGASAGLTQNCYDVADPNDPMQLDRKQHPTQPGPARTCPVISVSGGAPGVAMIGFQGIGTDGDDDADWAQDSGGADLVAFDGAKASRTRHVFIASPPHTICPSNGNEGFTSTCSYEGDWFWVTGRRKLRQVLRIATNHDKASPLYGDTWMGGTHASFSALLANAEKRGWVDEASKWPGKWLDAKDVWEHDHPGIMGVNDRFLTGYTRALAIHPRTGVPWASNGFRTTTLEGYGAKLSSKSFWQPTPWLDVWTDSGDPELPGSFDAIEALTFCDDGAMWMGSSLHGLARRDPSGAVTTLGLPDPGLHGDSVTALACDPSDGSLWVGLGWGGLMRYKDGAFTAVDPLQFPPVVGQPVQSIQLDRWSSPRIVYVAFGATTDRTTKAVRPGGVGAYAGP